MTDKEANGASSAFSNFGAKLMMMVTIASLSITIVIYGCDVHSLRQPVHMPPPHRAAHQTKVKSRMTDVGEITKIGEITEIGARRDGIKITEVGKRTEVKTNQGKTMEVGERREMTEGAKPETTKSKPKVEVETKPMEPEMTGIFAGVINVSDTDTKFSSALWSAGCQNETTSLATNHTTCNSPRRKILFVKVHKCGGSTMTSLLLRYGRRNKLNVALPEHTNAHFGYPKLYRSSYVYNFWPPPYQYDIVASHMVYDRCYVQKDFPRKDFIYTALLREPWSQFVSALNYFKFTLLRPPKLKKPMLKHVLENQDKYAVPIRFQTPPDRKATKNLFKNMMSTDLGFMNEQVNNQSAIDLFIERLDKDFDFVMILEYYHESLVLLKRLMCWTLADILYLKLNSKVGDRIGKEKITNDMKEKHKTLDKVDYILYDHYKRKLEEKIQKEGKSLQDEVAVFNKILEKFHEFCKSGKYYSNRSLILKKNKFMDEIRIPQFDCHEYLKMPSVLVRELKRAV